MSQFQTPTDKIKEAIKGSIWRPQLLSDPMSNSMLYLPKGATAPVALFEFSLIETLSINGNPINADQRAVYEVLYEAAGPNADYPIIKLLPEKDVSKKDLQEGNWPVILFYHSSTNFRIRTPAGWCVELFAHYELDFERDLFVAKSEYLKEEAARYMKAHRYISRLVEVLS